MDFVDQALARRLEAAEEMPQVHYARLYQKLRPEIGAAVEPICGGHMIFAGGGSPIGRTVGMGFDGSASVADLDCMIGGVDCRPRCSSRAWKRRRRLAANTPWWSRGAARLRSAMRSGWDSGWRTANRR